MTKEEWKLLERQRRIEKNYQKPVVQEKKYDAVKANTDYYTPEGEIIWPPNRGLLEDQLVTGGEDRVKAPSTQGQK